MLFGSLAASPNERSGLRTFPAGGYSVFRGNGEAPAVLTFDHGPLGYLSIAAHGHADSLAVWLSAGSQPIFVDAGTYRYHSRKALRDGLRDTAVHNTLTLCGVASSRPSGLFNWATKAVARCVAAEKARPRGSWPSMTGIWRGLGSSTGAQLRSMARAGSRSPTSLLALRRTGKPPFPSCSTLLHGDDRAGWKPAH